MPKWHTYQITLRWQYVIWSAFRWLEEKYDQNNWNLHWNFLTPTKLLWQNIAFDEKKKYHWNNMNKRQPLQRTEKKTESKRLFWKELTQWKWHNENSGSCISYHQCVCVCVCLSHSPSFSFHFIELSGCAYNLCAMSIVVETSPKQIVAMAMNLRSL